MSHVEIEYCVPCGFLDRAEDVQHALLSSLGEDLEAVTLRTGDHGVFRVDVDGETVFDKADDEFDVDGIVRDVRNRL
ncbi:SelT/SelW/SelH family protein [Halostella sp. JP-L12]|uniref:SelT/SelW/SelH family protein n=1 Tax=Halostella TaxID=1843185 RepID=UPI000EF76FFC|nr:MULTISPECIES: Rdx family protein [Halostella]NHN49575.1 SelT/SelW/SelH family protein [Halostella sp. JP-L12]